MAASDEARQRFERLFRGHHEAVLGYVRRRAPLERVDDLVAETFLVAWRRLDQVPEDPLPWLLGVARRVISTGSRSERRRRALGLRLSREPYEHVAPPEPEGEVGAALARLAPNDREALTLIAWEGLTPAQAATVLGESPGTFRVRLHRARTRIAALLEIETETEAVHE